MSEYDVDLNEPERFRAKVKHVEDKIQSLPNENRDEARQTLLGALTREQAIAYGKMLGEDEAGRRRETGTQRDERIRRAMAYAAWEFDGKPEGGAHLREFSVPQTATPSLERAPRALRRPDPK